MSPKTYLKLYRQGITMRDIAKRFGLSRKTIAYHINRLEPGISSRRRARAMRTWPKLPGAIRRGLEFVAPCAKCMKGLSMYARKAGDAWRWRCIECDWRCDEKV